MDKVICQLSPSCIDSDEEKTRVAFPSPFQLPPNTSRYVPFQSETTVVVLQIRRNGHLEWTVLSQSVQILMLDS